MIVDCFTFFNELDLLEMRLAVLDGVVDRFVICEAPFTFRGTAKPLHFREHRERFARWLDRIDHIVYEGPADANPWKNEWGQRAALTRAVTGLAPDDLVLIGDVDEIPAPANVACRPGPGRVLGHRQRLSVGYFNRIAPDPWIGTRALPRAGLGTRDLNEVRLIPHTALDVIDGGWHLSALGGAAVMAAKFHAYSHAECDIPYYNDVRSLATEFATETGAAWTPFDDSFPAPLHAARWAKFVWPQPVARDAGEIERTIHAHGCLAYVPDGARTGILARDAHDVWQRAGQERAGAAFAGVFASAADALAQLAPGDWIVVDGIERFTERDLRPLARAGIHAVAYARNARSFAILEPILAGAPFPPGAAFGVPEMVAAIADAEYVVAARDVVTTRSIFAPQSLYPAHEPFEAAVGPFRFAAATREVLGNFVAHGFIFTLRPLTPSGDGRAQ